MIGSSRTFTGTVFLLPLRLVARNIIGAVIHAAISSALSFMRSNIVRVRDGFRPDLRFVSDALNSPSALVVARK